MKHFSQYIFLLSSLLIISISQNSCTNKAEPESDTELRDLLTSRRVLLPNGWSLSVPGKSLAVGDFPLNLIASNDGQVMAVTNNGQSEQSIMLVDPNSFEITNEITIPKSWYGLAFNKDHSKLFASGGNDNRVRIYDTSKGTLIEESSIILGAAWPKKISPTGLILDQREENIYVVTKEDSSLYKVNLITKESKRLRLGYEAYSCLFSKDESMLYVSLWGGKAIAQIDPENLSLVKTIPVGSHPNDLVLTHDGKFLFTSCANDNSVHIIDVKSGKVIEQLNTACFPDAPAGSTPNALAISDNDKRLYVANADNNSLAVFDISEIGESRSLGFIPTGWYPTSVRVVNEKIMFTNGLRINFQS